MPSFCLALPLPPPPSSILVEKHSIWGLNLTHQPCTIIHCFPNIVFGSLWLWMYFFSDNHASLHFHPVNSFLLILQASASSLLPPWHFTDGSQQNWSVSVFSQHFVQASIITGTLLHWIVVTNFTCLSLPFEIALSSSLPSHIKANKQKPVSPLSGNFTWSWQPFLLSSISFYFC